MEERKHDSPTPRLDLNNFDTKDAQGNRYVLTSPRSLESCARLGVRPVELLHKSLSEFADEHKHKPVESVTVLYEAYEKERKRLLRLCRDEREKVIEEEKGGRSSLKKLFLNTVTEQSTESQSSQSKLDKVNGPDILGVGAHISLQKQTSSTLESKTKYLSVDLRNQQCPSTKRWGVSPGDMKHSQAASRKLNRLMKAMSHKDRKIATLMLLKHEEEQLQQQRSEQEARMREEAQNKEAKWRASAERRHRKELEHRNKLWQEALKARKRRQHQEELRKTSLRELQQALRVEQWKRRAEEQEVRRRQHLEVSQREAEERKHDQARLLEKQKLQQQRGLEQEIQRAMDREVRASRRKQNRDRELQRQVHQENQKHQLRHVLLKREVEEQAQACELLGKSALEEKLQRFKENHAQRLEMREQELQERATWGEELGRRARLRVMRQEHQKEQRWQILAQLGECRLEQATQQVRAQSRQKAQQVRSTNVAREHIHQLLRERLLQEEEQLRHQRESIIANKERRCQQLLRNREKALGEAKRAARNSSKMREQIKEVIRSRTFDQMALEAEITATLGRCKL